MEQVLQHEKESQGRRPHRGEGANEGASGLHLGAQLQQQAGNQAVQHLLHGGVIHAKFAVSPPNDVDEQEAQEGSGRIMRSHSGAGAPSCSCGDDEENMCSECRQKQGTIARKASGRGGAGSPSQAVMSQMLRSPGHPLDHGTRAFFEPRFGRDVSHVRVHTDSNAAESASALRAHAYALGDDIWFGAGKYSPTTNDGQHLLAHEIAHTFQQQLTPGASTALHRNAVTVGRVNDPLEAEADHVANSVMHSPAPQAVVSADRTPAVRGHWYDPVVGAAEWVGDRAEDVGEAAWTGVKWTGRQAKAVGKWAWGKLSRAWECLEDVGGSILAPIDIESMMGKAKESDDEESSSLKDMVGKDAPTAEDPSTVDEIIKVLQHPCIRMIPGIGDIVDHLDVLEKAAEFLKAAWHVITHPQEIIDGLKTAIGKFIVSIPGYVNDLVQKTLQNVGSKLREHGEGVWRHLEPKLSYLAANWWEVLKDAAWTLLWPWPAVGKDLSQIWGHIKAAGSYIWDLRFSKALDEILAIGRGINSILGSLYGWFFIASVLVGAIVVPGAGALAGAAFAAEVGEGLVAFTVGIETASLLKAAYNLVAQKETPEEKEEDYEQIASSGLTLAITGVMALVGELAVKFAQGLFSKVAGLFRKAGATELKDVASAISEGAKEKPPTGEAPEVTGPDAEKPPSELNNSDAQTAESVWEDSVNPETREYLSEHPEVREVYGEMDPEMKWLCTHCSFNCLIEGLTKGQTKRIQALAEGLSEQQLEMLREFLHDNKANINKAISDLEKTIKKPAVDPLDAEADKAFAPTGDDPSGLYETTMRLIRGNVGERLATDVLAGQGHDILISKPSILGTNQGGIDIVTIKNGEVYLIDNKALTRAGNVSSVSALTTNFKQNLQSVLNDLTARLADPALSSAERQIMQEAVDALNAGKYVKAVTNANLFFEGAGTLSGVTDTLANQGIQFIDVMGNAPVPTPAPVPVAP